jgi:hypothetical protein
VDVPVVALAEVRAVVDVGESVVLPGLEVVGLAVVDGHVAPRPHATRAVAAIIARR